MTKTNGYQQDATGQWRFHFPDGRSTRASLRTCEECGVEFPSYRTQRFCSVACRGRAREVLQPTRECVNCRAVYTPIVKTQRYCSHVCAAKSYHARQEVTTSSAVPIKNVDNAHYQCDERGQWWYSIGGEARTRAVLKVCPECGATFLSSIYHRTTVHCSKRCAHIVWNRENPGMHAKERSGRWKGGTFKEQDGYVLQLAPDHPSLVNTAKRYVFQHRLVMEQKIGRILRSEETVHHKNGIRDDNRPENLELWAKSHPPGQRVADTKGKSNA